MAQKRRSGPTIYDVARAAGVSTATVSRALNDTGQTAPATREAIEEAVRSLGYRPNTIARSLVTRSTQTIALLLPDITSPFYPSLVKGVQEAASSRGYTMLLCMTDGDPEREEGYLDLLRAKSVDGALVDGLVLPRARIARFVSEGFPIVSLDREIDFPATPLVQVNNRLGARLASEHLIALGHRRIAHITGLPGLRNSAERETGYREALKAAGIKPDRHLVVSGDYTGEGGYAAAQKLLELEADFTALFAANDITAIGAMEAIMEGGWSIPADVSVVGFDNVSLANYTSPPLTTVHQPAAEIGRRAGEILIELIHGRRLSSRRQILEPELVVRASTAPARQPGGMRGKH